MYGTHCNNIHIISRSLTILIKVLEILVFHAAILLLYDLNMLIWTGQSSNSFTWSIASIGHIYLQLSSYTCGSQCSYICCWSCIGTGTCSIVYINDLHYFSLNIECYCYVDKKNGGNGKKRSNRMMIVVSYTHTFKFLRFSNFMVSLI